jgi:hypothetical protein
LLLIITNRDDLTADFLITRLLETGQSYFRINSEDLAEAGYLFSAGGHEDVTRRYTVAGKSLDLSDIRSVWYRRMVSPSPSQTIFPEQRRFAAGEIRHLVEGLILDPSILWVNPIDATALGGTQGFFN